MTVSTSSIIREMSADELLQIWEEECNLNPLFNVDLYRKLNPYYKHQTGNDLPISTR